MCRRGRAVIYDIVREARGRGGVIWCYAQATNGVSKQWLAEQVHLGVASGGKPATAKQAKSIYRKDACLA